jgi:hypothetical protein
MADEPQTSPDEGQDTSLPEAPDTPDTPESSDQADVDYEKRYNDLRPEYDRSQQLLAALEGRYGDEVQEQALQMVNLEVAGDDEPDEEDYEDEGDEGEGDEPMTRAEFAEYVEANQAEQDAIESQQAFHVDLNDVVEQIEEAEGRTLSDEETRILYREAQGQVV